MEKLLNVDQMVALSRNTRGLKWSNETVMKALKLRFSCGDTGYKDIISTGGLPLPSVRTLQEKLKHIDFRPGILSSVFNYLQTKVN